MGNNFSPKIKHIVDLGQREALREGATSVSALVLLLAILSDDSCEAHLFLRSLGVNTENLRSELLNCIHQGASENTESPKTGKQDLTLDNDAERILRLSQLEARLQKAPEAGDIHILRALLRDKVNEGSRILKRYGIDYSTLQKSGGNSAQTTHSTATGDNAKPKSAFGFKEEDDDELEPIGGAGDSMRASTTTTNRTAKSDTPIIDNYGTDLTQLAREGVLDPIVGRHDEIERMAQILSRRKKNNPILIGEPGVGKSALVEGLAQLIVRGEVPHLLSDKRIVGLDLASLVAGTQYRGQFEERIRRLIDELKAHREIVLFIDEIHTIIGAGGAQGSLDAANILKPALARGEVQCIGATTVNEFKKSIEKDGALDRRFQKILLEPTTAADTLAILKNIKSRYEDHHAVTYTDEALEACVSLTERYVTDRALPDKAIDALDEAGSRVHILGVTVPSEITTQERDVKNLTVLKDAAAERQDYETAANLRDQLSLAEKRLEELRRAWHEELEAHRIVVTADDIAGVVSKMSGVPAERVREDETERLRSMKDVLSSRVIAQDQAIARLCRSITRNRLGLKDPNRPIGTFMFVGPTGVGKTHLVKTLAEHMFGHKDALVRIDMSEYGEKFSVSRLVGAPPGYVGYEEGGQLTEKVRRHPYSIVLLDEIEKAHPDVFNTLLQVMDEGRMTDGNGTTVDFRNTIIVLTSNSGTRQLKDFGTGVGFGAVRGDVDATMAESIVRKALQKQFAPEFLNRLDDIIMFDPLNRDSVRQITTIETDALARRITEGGRSLQFTPAALDILATKGFDQQYGARALRRAIQTLVEDPICDMLLEGCNYKDILADAADDGQKLVFSEAAPKNDVSLADKNDVAPADSNNVSPADNNETPLVADNDATFSES